MNQGRPSIADTRASALLRSPACAAIVFFVAYYALTRASSLWRLTDAHLPLLLPESGLLLGALLLTPLRRWWIVLLAMAVAHIAAHAGETFVPWHFVWQVAHTGACSFAVAFTLRLILGERNPFATLRDTTAYIFLALLVPAATAWASPHVARSALGLSEEMSHSVANAWGDIALPYATTFLTLTPALWLWARHGADWLRAGQPIAWAEVTLIALAIGVLQAIHAPAYALLFPMLWAAARYGAGGAASATLFVALLLFTAPPHNPLGASTSETSTTDLYAYLLVIASTTLALGAIIDTREAVAATLRKQLEQADRAVTRGARLAAVGEVTASIAHEINQPLTAALNDAQAGIIRLESGSATHDEVLPILRDIRGHALRASAVIQRLRTVLQGVGTRPGPLDLASVVQDVAALVSAETKRRDIDLRIACPPAPLVLGDRTQLQQVLLNLILNSMDALAEAPPARRWIAVNSELRERGRIEVHVIDCGPGIPVERLPRIFESFYTSKADGMGLGLSISRAIVESHGGRIWAENRSDGDGAIFRFDLPIITVVATPQHERLGR